MTDRFHPEEFIINDLILALKDEGFYLEVLTQQPSYPYGSVKKYKGFNNWVFQTSEWNGIRVSRILTITGYKTKLFFKLWHYVHFAVLCSFVLILQGYRYRKIFVFQTGPLTQALPAVLSKKLYGNEIFIWTLDLWPDAVYTFGFKKKVFLVKILDICIKTVYRNADTIAVSSEAFKNRILEYAPGKPIHFSPQWSMAQADLSECPINLDKTKFNFTFTGNIGTSQNLDKVLIGFNKAFQTNGHLILNIFGDGNNLENLRKIVIDYKIEGVIFWGRIPQTTMYSILSQSDVLLVSLRPDPLFDLYVPLKFPTYIYCRKPIFAVIGGEVKKIVEENKVGITADPANTDEIANGFSKFAKAEKEILDSYAENTIQLSNKLFNKQIILEKIKTLLQL